MVRDSDLPSPLISPIIGWDWMWKVVIENLPQPVLHHFLVEVIDINLKSQVRCDMTFHFITSFSLTWAHSNAAILPVWLQTFGNTKTQWRLPELLQTHNVTLFSHILPSERFCPLPPDIIGATFEETNPLNYLCRLVSRTWVTGCSNNCSTSCQCSRFSWKRRGIEQWQQNRSNNVLNRLQ